MLLQMQGFLKDMNAICKVLNIGQPVLQIMTVLGFVYRVLKNYMKVHPKWKTQPGRHPQRERAHLSMQRSTSGRQRGHRRKQVLYPILQRSQPTVECLRGEELLLGKPSMCNSEMVMSPQEEHEPSTKASSVCWMPRHVWQRSWPSWGAKRTTTSRSARVIRHL